MHTKLSKQLKEILSETQMKELSRLVQIQEVEIRQHGLKSFFHDPLVFDKVKSLHDPTWLAYDIFINGHRYEF